MQVKAHERTKQSKLTESLLEILQIKDRLFLLFEYCEQREPLDQLIKDNPGIHLAEEDAIDFALYILAKGVQELHKQKIVIGNLTAQSVQCRMDDTKSMQISDLSKCRVIDEGEPIELNLTIEEKSFAAPEVRINHEVTP